MSNFGVARLNNLFRPQGVIKNISQIKSISTITNLITFYSSFLIRISRASTGCPAYKELLEDMDEKKGLYVRENQTREGVVIYEL